MIDSNDTGFGSSGMRASVVLLWHFRIGPGDDWDEDGSERLVGMYSSEAEAEAAMVRLRRKPGFSDWPEGFRIFGTWLDQVAWMDGFVTWEEALAVPLRKQPSRPAAQTRTVPEAVPVVPGLLVHNVLHRCGDEGHDEKSIGIFSSRARAQAAIERLQSQPGFRDWPEGFHIREVRLDQDLWPNGFSV